MDFRQVGRAIRSNLLVALAVLFLFIFIGGAAAYLPAMKYQASTILLAEPNPAVDPANAVAAIQFFLPQLGIEAQDQSVLAKAAKKVPAKLAHVPVSIVATADPETGTLTVQGTSTNPAASAAFVNANVDVLKDLQKNNGVYSLVEPSRATIPEKPSNPRKAVLFGAVAFGLIAAVFAALGADAVRRRLSKVEETRSAAGLPVLAEVPRVRRHALLPAQVFGAGSDSMVLEAFQELRSNLLLALPANRLATIAVTSGDSGEGKSSVTADLAWALASERQPVTAVDCDLRKPTMHLLLGDAIGPGVSGCGSLELSRLLSPTSNPYLNFIPAGIPTRHPVDIVSSYVPSLLTELREEGRHVIVDCPPLNGIAETLLLASLADVVVLVVDARHFDPAHVQQFQARLQEAGAKVIGVVLNRVWIGAKRRKRHYDYGVPTAVDTIDMLPSQVSVPSKLSVAPKTNESLPRSG